MKLDKENNWNKGQNKKKQLGKSQNIKVEKWNWEKILKHKKEKHIISHN